jgi:DNA-binding ferritin-like protein
MAIPNVKISAKKKQSPLAGTLVSKLLLAAAQIHVFHLITPSYAAHKALNELYDALPDLADSLAESMQQDEILSGYNQSITLSDSLNPVAYITELRDYVTSIRAEVSTESYVQNQIDSIIEVLNSTLYKLKKLS